MLWYKAYTVISAGNKKERKKSKLKMGLNYTMTQPKEYIRFQSFHLTIK